MGSESGAPCVRFAKGFVKSKRVPGGCKDASAAPEPGANALRCRTPQLVDGLEEMIDYQTRGDPESALRWIGRSTQAIANQLSRHKHPVSHAKVAQLLHGLNYSLQSNRKTEDHPDRDAQFRHINAAVKRCLAEGGPVISVCSPIMLLCLAGESPAAGVG